MGAGPARLAGPLPEGVGGHRRPDPTVWIIGTDPDQRPRRLRGRPPDPGSVPAHTPGPLDRRSRWRPRSRPRRPVAPATDSPATADPDVDRRPHRWPTGAMPAESSSTGPWPFAVHPPHVDRLVTDRPDGAGGAGGRRHVRRSPPSAVGPGGRTGRRPGRVAKALPRLANVVNGWQLNIDTMGVYGNSYVKRAIVAMVGLGANSAEDALYPLLQADAEGSRVRGEPTTSSTSPPTVCLPSMPSGRSPCTTGRGSRSRTTSTGCNRRPRPAVFNPDGSLDLYLQHRSPGPVLGSPTGCLRPRARSG